MSEGHGYNRYCVNRLIRYFNFAVALLLVVMAGAVVWFIWRPMPQLSGEVKAQVSRPLSVRRDAQGVPHIEAASIEDALYAQGYVTAQDRLWQMDAIRRLATGELAEIVGAGALELDRDSRRLRIRRAAEDHVRTMPDADRALLAAYARGVNDSMDAQRGALPVEFRLLQYAPRPWSMADTVAISIHMHRSLTTSWRDDLQKAQMLLAAADKAKVEALWPIRSGREVMPGSNAWAISGKWTASGKPLLANDPHLEFAFPSTWYQAHLKGGPLDVIGVTLPGVPGVVIGHNQRIAWGMTNVGFDVQDLYIERLDSSTGQYLYQGKPQQARVENEQIVVKGGGSVAFQQFVTRHGPVIANASGQALALRWTATEPGSFQFPIVEMNLAQNWPQFLAALKRYPGPSQNLVYADVDGNIGYHATGLLPIRRNFNGDVPVDGSSGEFEWAGYMPFEELPQTFNPPSGTFITGNQNPWPADSPYRINGSFHPPDRALQIQWRLQAKKAWTPQEMVSIQTDVYSPSLHHLAGAIARVWDRKGRPGSAAHEAAQLLKSWNGQVDRALGAPYIATLTFERMRKSLAEIAAPGKGNEYTEHMAYPVIEEFLAKRPAGWVADWDAFVLESFQDAVEEAKRQQGGDPKRWRWGTRMTFALPHSVLGRIAGVGSYFTIGPLEMSGGTTTVKQTTLRMGPSMRFVADLANWDTSLNNITVGQSGHPLSSHFRDQWDAYLAGRSFPMQFLRVDAKDTLTLTPSAR